MRIYSKSIETFLKRINIYVREILQNEFRVRVARTRFHLSNGWNYPIIIVAIDDSKILGHFNSEDCSIGINRCLMYKAKTTVIKNVLRHELAHFLLYTENHKKYNYIMPHGLEFKNLCRRYGFNEEIYSPNVDIRKENNALVGDIRSEKIIVKIQKLLSLTKSDNEFEAELATIKANQLITQHNLQAVEHYSCSKDEIEYITKLILTGIKLTPRMSAISKILREFFVYPVKAKAGLEITGSAANVENGEYIAHFLNNELKQIWSQHRKNNSKLKEKAFMVALADSYRKKLKIAQDNMPNNNNQALIIIKKELDWATNGIYGGLTTSSSTYTNCTDSSNLGNKAGNNLQINRGISTTGITRLLESST